MNSLILKHVSKDYGEVRALNAINLTLPSQQICCIIGLSGSGKSTLLRLLNRLIEPTSGEVWVGKQHLARLSPAELRQFRQHQIAMVFQHFNLLPNLTVQENVEYGLKIKGIDKAERHWRARAWLTEVGLADQAANYPHALSGGMQQRVGIARAFACDTPILLMDEPFSALDPLNRKALQNLLRKLQAKWQKTIVFVSHDLDEVQAIADYVVLLDKGELVQIGKFDELKNQPKNEFVREFLAANKER